MVKNEERAASYTLFAIYHRGSKLSLIRSLLPEAERGSVPVISPSSILLHSQFIGLSSCGKCCRVRQFSVCQPEWMTAGNTAFETASITTLFSDRSHVAVAVSCLDCPAPAISSFPSELASWGRCHRSRGTVRGTWLTRGSERRRLVTLSRGGSVQACSRTQPPSQLPGHHQYLPSVYYCQDSTAGVVKVGIFEKSSGLWRRGWLMTRGCGIRDEPRSCSPDIASHHESIQSDTIFKVSAGYGNWHGVECPLRATVGRARRPGGQIGIPTRRSTRATHDSCIPSRSIFIQPETASATAELMRAAAGRIVPV